jgi:ferredoxin-fold anticodon binding domain-containing protein
MSLLLIENLRHLSQQSLREFALRELVQKAMEIEVLPLVGL